jgi:hypothetical protein
MIAIVEHLTKLTETANASVQSVSKNHKTIIQQSKSGTVLSVFSSAKMTCQERPKTVLHGMQKFVIIAAQDNAQEIMSLTQQVAHVYVDYKSLNVNLPKL